MVYSVGWGWSIQVDGDDLRGGWGWSTRWMRMIYEMDEDDLYK
jgi:hypothetical protein